MFKTAAILATTIACFGCVGSSKTVDDCQKSILFVQTASNDAQLAISHVRAVMHLIPDDKHQELEAQLLVATVALRNIDSYLLSANRLCSALQHENLFASFNTAWTVIRSILAVSLVSVGTGTTESLQVLVQDPICYKK